MKLIKISDISAVNIEEYFKDVVVIPTETVYGLAARIDNEYALKRIYQIKGRPSDNPLIVHISSIRMLEELITGGIPSEHQKLIDRFWPGPLTLIFKCNDIVSETIRGKGLDTVAVRMPESDELRGMIERLGVPLAAPSANTSGKPSPTTVQHVIDDFGEKVSLYIDGGPCKMGVESTVFGILEGKPTVLRPGGINLEDIEETLKCTVYRKNKIEKGEKAVSPGQKYRHYSPNVPVYLFKGDSWESKMSSKAIELLGKRIGVLCPTGYIPSFEHSTFFDLGKDIKEWCKNLFSGLRELESKCDVIFVRETASVQEGFAFMDRIDKAASVVVE